METAMSYRSTELQIVRVVSLSHSLYLPIHQPRSLRLRFAGLRLPVLRFRIPPSTWMYFATVECCQAEVSATGRSLVRRSPTEFVCPGVWPVAIITGGRDSSVGIATRYRLDGPGIECRWGRDFPHPSRPAPGPIQSPIQWVPRFSTG